MTVCKIGLKPGTGLGQLICIFGYKLRSSHLLVSIQDQQALCMMILFPYNSMSDVHVFHFQSVIRSHTEKSKVHFQVTSIENAGDSVCII